MERASREYIASFIRSPYLHLALRLLVGIIFLLSAVSKLPHHTEFEAIVKDFDLLPDALATAYANALPWVELLTGVYLILGILVRPSLIVILVICHSFLIGNIHALSRGDDYCGNCFGDLWTIPVWQALAIDLCIMFATAILLLAKPRLRLFSLEQRLRRAPDIPGGS